MCTEEAQLRQLGVVTHLANWSGLEIQGVIRFVWAREASAAAIHLRQCSDVQATGCWSRPRFCIWRARYDLRSSSTTDVNTGRVEVLVQTDRRRGKAGYTPVRYARAGMPVQVYRMPVVHPHAPVNLSGFTVTGWPSPWHASVCLYQPFRRKNTEWLFIFVPVACAGQNNCAVLCDRPEQVCLRRHTWQVYLNVCSRLNFAAYGVWLWFTVLHCA